MEISIIITARNNGKYLAEAIESCLAQTVKPLEIIYSDDFSTDNSLEIAESFLLSPASFLPSPVPIIVLKHDHHLGVVAARNAGAAIASGKALVFLDGDDILPPDFLEKHLQVFDYSTPFVYCAAQAFGTANHFWPVYSWKTRFLWNRNFVNTSAMIWKDAFLKVGGWKETCENTMWDWSLALRLSRLGTPRKSPAVLHYRQHPDSWSHQKEKAENQLLPLSESIRRELVTLTIGLIYSGRIPGFISKWMKSLVNDISILSQKPQLVIINNSDEDLSPLLPSPVSLLPFPFSEIKIISGQKLKWSDETDRRNKVCELLSEQYNMILENATGELIHLREDDIIPNPGSFKRIFDLVTSGNPVREAVAGIYLNRNPNYRRIVGGFYNHANPRQTSDLTTTPSINPFIVDFTGTGFLIFWKDLCPTFAPYADNGIQAHDWAWGLKLKKLGGRLWMDPASVCKHHITEDEYLEYDPTIEINTVNTFTRIPMDDNQKPQNSITIRKGSLSCS